MVIVVIALAEGETGNEPTVAAAVALTVGLSAEHMGEGINGERGIQDHEHSKHAREHKTADTADESPVHKAQNEGKREAGNHDRVVVLMLPHHHRILPQLPLVIFRPVRRIDEEPDAVTVPKPFLGVVWIFLLIRPRMVPDMIRAPPQRGILKRPSPGDQQQKLDPWMAFETTVRNQPMIADGYAESGDHVENGEEHPIKNRVAIEIAKERRADQCRCGNEAKQDERFIGKRLGSDSVWHPSLPLSSAR